MAQCVVIADDLTGGNATGVLLRKMNYQADTVLNLGAVDPALIKYSDCVVYPTDSRGVSPEEAYRRVYKACEVLAGPDVKIYTHRIDSTLRGNLGSETDAMLDYLGEDYVAVAAPCFPATARIVCGGYMLVEGIPLHQTNIAIDPKTPVLTSDVAALFRGQSKYPVAALMMDELMKGADHLAARLKELAAEGVRTITLDCITQEDLDLIADAVIASGLKFIAVDPGVFTATLVGRLIAQEASLGKYRILSVVGSVNSRTLDQMRYVWKNLDTGRVMVETKKLLESDEACEEEIARVVNTVLYASAGNQVLTVTGDGIYPENRIDFAPYMEKFHCSMDDVTALINRSFAEIAYRIFRAEPSFRGLYTSGGDVTVAVCERFETAGLRLKDEVLPLAAYGEFLGGEFQGVHIVTKGGSQGDETAIARCLSFLKEKIAK
ncbi:MAG: four-carbon acid sugar kinase family protein [Lachnospiraceae bacterium]|nr:four-carbon acid sugar kinase family protein [Lachnospiraceae bacterium]